MAWKWFKNDWDIAGFLLFITDFSWAIYLISFVIYSIIFLLDLFLSGSSGFYDFPVRIHVEDFAEVIANSEEENIFQNSTFDTSFNTSSIEIKNKWSYYLVSAMSVGLYGVALYGLTLLSRILQSLRKEQPWNKQNSKDLRIIGYLMVLAVPYKYGIGWLSYLMIQQIQLPESVSLLWPPIAWEIGLAGLAVILVAYIFEEGTRLYQEQKLTV